MKPAIVSLLALLAAIGLSMTSHINVGVVSLALAWVVGVFVAGMKPEAVMGGFPATLFLTLAGVTLLFACAETNGTLERLAHRAVRMVRGRRRALPFLFFLLALMISSVGPGAISSVALVIPLAMAIGLRAGVPPLLTALMVANGANAGNLSPVSAVGVIANNKMAEAGLGGHAGKVWFANFVAHLLAALAAYLLFGRQKAETVELNETAETDTALNGGQKLTLAIILLWVGGALFFQVTPGLSAFAAAAVLILARAADEAASLKQMPWGVMVMVCGVSALVALLEETGGMEQFTALLARVSTPRTVNGVIAFITGVISTYSSTSGVVLPAFLPIAPKLAQQIGGGDPLAVALSINVGSALVDVSPLSTLGALCVATINDPAASHTLFRQLLVWGLAMSVVAALFCLLLAGLIARA
jgi:di/tricarboxylate transporter